MITTFREVWAGAAFLVRGVQFLAQRPRLALLGMVPPLIVWTAMIALLAVLALCGLEPLTAMMTGWVPESTRLVARVIAGIVIMVSAVVIAVIVFSSVTMAVGAPIYERISIAVETQQGGAVLVPAERALPGALRGAGQSLAVVALSVLGGGLVFLLGLIPLVGGAAAVVAGAMLAGYLITLELTSGVFDRRGRRALAKKFAALRRRRAVTLGFGIPLFVIFSVPLMSVVFFPAATAGAAMLAVEVDRGGR